MAFAPSPATLATPPSDQAPQPRYTSALASMTVLFFAWGFITCLNDILIPYLKAVFSLSYAQANMINFCFFGAYFIMGIPAGKVVQRFGYKSGMLLGFLVAAVGCFLFYPAATSRSYGLFLGALFVLATGIVLLQVAANPYVAILGPAKSASARLTLTQAFNSLGTYLAPLLGSALILSQLPKTVDGASAAPIDVTAVQVPYLIIGTVLLLISLLLSRVHLPQIAHVSKEASAPAIPTRAWNYRHLLLGVGGIFAYVGAEVAIGSHIVNYLALPDVMGLLPEAAGKQVANYWFAAMVGRFLGAYLLNKFNPGRLLAGFALGAILLVLLSVNSTGEIAMWSLLAVGLMNSLMFSTIFTLALVGLGEHTEEASGLLVMAIVGGAIVPLLFGLVADASTLRWAFALPVLCYAYVLWYGWRGHRPQPAASAL